MTRKLKNRFVRGLAALSPTLLVAPVYAQSTAPAGDSVEEVVVTGIRESLNRARDIKRESTQIVDAIVADDIGKLPDRNVAESLARVSGVQVDRGIAEGTSVSVRGLRQNVYLFNGRQIVDPTGRGGAGLDTLGSSTYGLLSLVPSELISRLELTKLASADQIDGALGGIVDVQTRKPLEGPDQIAAKVGGTYYDQASEDGYEAFALASHKFAGDTLGVLVSASFNRRNLSQEGLDTFSGYSRFTDSTGTVRFGNADARPEEIAETRKNVGLSGMVQWQPADGVELTADTFYSKLDSDRNRWWLSFTPTAGLSNAEYSPNNILLKGRATGPVLTNTEFLDTEANIWSSALSGKFDINDRLRASAELAYTESESTAHQIYFRMQPIVGVSPTVDFDFTAGDLGSYQISGIDLTDPSQLRYTILFDNLYDVRSEDTAARTDWTYDLDAGALKSISVGARYENIDSEQNPLRADIRPTGGIPATALSSYLTLHSNPGFASGEFEGLPRSYLTANPSVSSCSAFGDVPAISQNVQCLDPRNNTNALSSTFEIKEKFTSAYTKVDFGTELGSANLSGNIGVRYLHRELESIGNQIAPTGGATASTFERNDSDFLPSAVTKLELTDDLVFRLGAARVIAYPNTADLNSGVTLANNAVFVDGVQTVLGTGTGGAPDLDPFKADQADLSAEYYFGEQALVSLGLFYKDVSTFIIQQQSPETYGGVNYLVNRKVNGEGAEVKGVEVLVQLPFYFLPEAFDGFGIIASYSYIDSSTPIKDVAGRVLPLPGLSPNNVNFVGYFERGPFSARLAYNWRDDYLVGLSAAATGIYNSPYTDLSATLRYDVNDAVSLGFEANNLLDEKQRTYDGVDEALRTNLFFGRIYKASVSLKF
ncbi:TonB-dependent receptor [Peristeroidobacter agariperforans]|uniref:TonB-dependent receptor n=1 Tax=Peristeroidobacter agariperforans TaxID=268404 RepID=UPI0013001B44|nr:TonB-dependent receptor [Peristeroidobacter agariperforans]